MLAAQAEGRDVVTVEGIAQATRHGDGLHEVQRAFVEAGGVQCGFCTPGLIVASHDLLRRNPRPSDPEIREALAGNLCRCTGYEKILDAVRLAGERIAEARTSDDAHGDRRLRDRDRRRGRDRVSRRAHRDRGRPDRRRRRRARAGRAADTAVSRRIDGRGHLATPGLVNCHHHLYQWATRGLAQQATLFEWLVELYPVWALIDDEICWAAARAGLAALARSGCSASTDHHYVFPRDAGDLLEVEIGAAASVGLRFHPCRGSMDLGRSDGGLPPDEVVEDRDAILAASEAAISRFHDPAPGAMVRIALAPCSPFSVTRGLMTDAAELARRRGVRLHTHLAETLDEERFCQEQLRRAPGRLPRRARLAGRRRLARALCAPRRRRDRPLRRHRHRRRPLPELERAARRGDRTGRRA